MMWWWEDSWSMGWSWLFGLLLLIGIVLLIVLIVRVVRGGSSRGGNPGTAGLETGPSRARQILDERYAKGELTAEQYREQVQVLRES